MAYKGKFRPKNTDKYSGDHQNITYRSLWERNAMKWCDLNPDVVKWNSESVVIPYICGTDGKQHRYYLDLAITFKSEKTLLVEIKPNKETKPPKTPKTTKSKVKYLKEALTYTKNTSKWKAARKFAEAHGVEFQIWDEHTLEALGIRTLTKKKKKA